LLSLIPYKDRITYRVLMGWRVETHAGFFG
jgi:hypothetical protein